jgi:hypothetical protein
MIEGGREDLVLICLLEGGSHCTGSHRLFLAVAYLWPYIPFCSVGRNPLWYINILSGSFLWDEGSLDDCYCGVASRQHLIY